MSNQSEGEERRLAAILSADAVGYSRLMAEDEPATVRTITLYREEIGLLVRQHHGRVVDAPGDNLLAEFPTATGALQCALEVQRVLGARNAALPPDRRMQFRIGIHLGEVRIEGERIYGDGVNIAARLEALAEPGGVLVSGAVHDQTGVRLDVVYDDLGEREVKNIPLPVRVYRVRSEPRAADSAPAASRPAARGRTPLALGGLAAALLLAIGGWWLWRAGPERVASTPEGALTVPGFEDRPAIAVLPFDNLSGDPEQEYFADGISEDLITRLSLWRSFPVIARNSSFVYKGQAVDVKRVSAELGVRYVVEGSVRRSGDRVRITAQLIDAPTGHHVWAETYDRELEDVFAVQDEITEAVAASALGSLQRAEGERALRREPGDLAAWDLVQRARWQLQSGEDLAAAQALFERALELDPRSVGAEIGLSRVAYYRFVEQRSEARERELEQTLSHARRAVQLDPQDPEAHMALAMAHSLMGEPGATEASARRAVELNPSHPLALGVLGTVVASRGRIDEGRRLLAKAKRLSPRDSSSFVFLDMRTTVAMAAGDYEQMVELARTMAGMRDNYSWPHVYLAVAYGSLGREDEARRELTEAQQLQPDLSLDLVRQGWSFASEEMVERIIEPLRAAGLE